MAARQIAQTQAANADANEPFHFVTDLILHATDLPVDALSQKNAQAFRTD